MYERLIGRNRGPDDKPEVVEHRLDEYFTHIEPVARAIKRECFPSVVEINANASVECIHEQLQNALDGLPEADMRLSAGSDRPEHKQHISL